MSLLMNHDTVSQENYLCFLRNLFLFQRIALVIRPIPLLSLLLQQERLTNKNSTFLWSHGLQTLKSGSSPNLVAQAPPRTSGDDDNDGVGDSDNDDDNVDNDDDDNEYDTDNDDEFRGLNPPDDIIVMQDDEDSTEEENRRVDSNLSELGGDPHSTEQPRTDWSATRISLADVTIPLSRFQGRGAIRFDLQKNVATDNTCWTG